VTTENEFKNILALFDATLKTNNDFTWCHNRRDN